MTEPNVKKLAKEWAANDTLWNTQQVVEGSLIRFASALNSESKLTSGLRELAEKWRQEAVLLIEPEFANTLDAENAMTLKRCVAEILALIPEATKETRNG